MLGPHHKIAIYAEASMGKPGSKMAEGVLRYSPNEIVCVIDSEQAGKTVRDVCPVPRSVPVVANLDEAMRRGADVLLLGTAPSGGRVPEAWWAVLDAAVANGLSIVNGLHDRLSERYPDLGHRGQWVWDVRVPAATPPPIATRRADGLANKRVLFVGTDMAIGKMTAGLEIYRWLRQANASVAFLATGQIGMTITGQGIPLDAIKVDHACGAVEQLVMSAADKDIVLIEGQGSLLHPGSTATLPLMRGACATHLILCHKAGLQELATQDSGVRIPPLKDVMRLNEAVAAAAGALTPATTSAIAINTTGLSEGAARDTISQLESETGVPVQDVVRFGAEKLAKPLLSAQLAQLQP